MELVFEMVSAQQFVPGLLTNKTFKQAGGVIGRAEDCDWVIPDLYVGDSTAAVPALYGLAFDISYNASLVQTGTEQLSYPAS